MPREHSFYHLREVERTALEETYDLIQQADFRVDVSRVYFTDEDARLAFEALCA